MKKIVSILRFLVFTAVALSVTSCEDFMTTNSTRYMRADDNLINSPSDTLYSIVGILSKMQKLSDKYVLTGELRGDLMSVSSDADVNLSDLSNFKADTTNLFTSTKDFYSVINNCNYFIQHVDTSMNVLNKKPFLNEFVVAKSIRAWAYLQLVLNHGKAYYFTTPILTISEARAKYPELGIEQMVDTLINDLYSVNPVVNNVYPQYSGITDKLFVNPLFLLGDLYLWRGSITHNPVDYEQAATFYAELLKNKKLKTGVNRITWGSDSFSGFSDSWSSTFFMTTDDALISIIQMAYRPTDGVTWTVPALCRSRNIYSSAVMDSLFAKQVYCYQPDQVVNSSAKYKNGDLRANGALTNLIISNSLTNQVQTLQIIAKYYSNNAYIYRSSLLYLRYAEALNRLGKPGVAFGILKYGINSTNMKSTTVDADKKPLFPQSELADNKPYITFFNDNLYTDDDVNSAPFKGNKGIHDNGCGDSRNNVYYVLPTVPSSMTPEDSIKYLQNAVDEKICDELALETGFEGNRFQDLMRLSNQRYDFAKQSYGDPTFLAKRVASKYDKADYYYYFNLLSDPNNWYLPTKKY